MKKDRAKPAAPEATPYDYDVFISYSHKEKAWVHGELLKRIEAAGLRAFIDFRDFTRGAPSIKEMERGVIKCRKTLLVLTPEYIDSEWCDIESVMIQTLGPANRDLRMIPLLKTPCDTPLRIAALTHVDFTDGADFDLAWRQLLTALGAAPAPPDVLQPAREHWLLAHPYAMPANFTGRVAERRMLSGWLTGDGAHPLLVLRALGGFGKSALTWHWLLNDVDPTRWSRVVWWSFYEGDGSFESFLASALRHFSGLGLVTPSASWSPRDQLSALLRILQSSGTLLLLDGFERALRAFGGLGAAYQGDEMVGSHGGAHDCLSPLAERFLRAMASLPRMYGKVLLTTRLRPSPVETRDGMLLQGCREEDLIQLSPADAVAFFYAQGIRGGRAEIEAACEPYGYHPLSLRLLAGLIVSDLQQPGDVVSAQRLDVSGDLVQRKHHVLEQAYMSLGSARQKRLCRIACFRSPVSYDALKALEQTESPHPETLTPNQERGRRPFEGSLDVDLRDLIARGLLHRDLRANRFDLHPIVRSYAYDRLAAPDRTGAHARLCDYFAAVPPPQRVQSLDDLAPVIELYHHTVRAGRGDNAVKLFRERLNKATYYQLGAYQLRIDLLRALFPEGEDSLPRLKDEAAQAWTLSVLANTYSLSGQPRRAVPLFERQIALREKHGSMADLAVGLAAIASVALLPMGALRAAETNLRRSIELGQQIKNKFDEATDHEELGRLLAYRGALTDSDTEMATGLKILEKQSEVQMQCVGWSYRAQRELVRLRLAATGNDMSLVAVDLTSAIAPARRALELAEEQARTHVPVERDYIRAHWLIGAAHRVAGEIDEAEHHLHQALERCRRINMVDHEGDIVIDLARLRMATALPEDAQRLAEEALVITDRCGYVLQGADAHLVLAQLAKDRGDAEALREHATEALRLATCDGPPDYTYKAAYDEASALLR